MIKIKLLSHWVLLSMLIFCGSLVLGCRVDNVEQTRRNKQLQTIIDYHNCVEMSGANCHRGYEKTCDSLDIRIEESGIGDRISGYYCWVFYDKETGSKIAKFDYTWNFDPKLFHTVNEFGELKVYRKWGVTYEL